MVHIKDAADQKKFFAHGSQFRPGNRLDETYFLRVVRAGEEYRESETFRQFDANPGATVGHFWPDGELRVTGRDYSSMIESKCFQKGDISCLSCHTMHQQDVSLQSDWKSDQLLPSQAWRRCVPAVSPEVQRVGNGAHASCD